MKKTLKNYFEEESAKKKLEELDDRIRQLAKKIDTLESRISLLEKEIDELKGYGKEKGAKKGYSSMFAKIMEEITKKGYITSPEISGINEADRERIVKRLEKMGIVSFSIEKEIMYVHPKVWKEFEEKLPEIQERDPVLVIEKLGIAGNLFNELYRRGLLYFDARQKRWKKA